VIVAIAPIFRPQARTDRSKAVVGELVGDREAGRWLNAVPSHCSSMEPSLDLSTRSHHVGKALRCTAIEVRMEAHNAVREQDTIRQSKMMLAGADRARHETA